MEQKRSSFSGKIGFVLASAGSAVGLGNIWRFPYLAAKYGGGIFLLVYLLLAITFGFVLMCAEIAIGRKTGKSAIDAYSSLNKKYAFIGVLGSIVPMIILPYYSVIGGWVSKYVFVFLSGGAADSAKDSVVIENGVEKTVSFFDTFVSGTFEPIAWFLLFLGLTAVIVLFGVEKGVEKVSKFLMPALVILTIGIAVYTVFIPSAMDGVVYYLKPDFSKFSANTVLGAMGQLFYSMSLSMGIMITYGSYMKKDINLESSVKQIEIFDCGIAFFAGLMVIPGVFAFSTSANAAAEVNKGSGLMFETLPKVFESIPGGSFIGAAFFILVFFAALTSSISLMETIVSILKDKFGWNRKLICLIVFLGCALVGLPSTLGNGIWSGFTLLGLSILDFFDFISNSVIMPIVALLTCLFVGYVIKPKALIEEVELTAPFKRKRMFTVMIKYVAPVCIVLILVSSVLDALGIMRI